MSKLVHFDSINSVFETSSANNSYTFGTSYNDSPNTFNASWTLSTPIQSASYITLASVELPYLWPTVRASAKNNTLTLTGISPQSWSITLPDRAYTSIRDLLDDINSAFRVHFPLGSGNGIFFSLNLPGAPDNKNYPENKGFVVCSAIAAINPEFWTPTTWSISGALLKLLGLEDISKNIVKSGGSDIIAAKPYNLSYDSYVIMRLTSPVGVENTNMGGVPSTWKIPINTGYSGILMQQMSAPVKCDTSVPIPRISVRLLDRDGNDINSMGIHWSFSLAFTP